MGLLDRLKSKRPAPSNQTTSQASLSVEAHLFGGDDDLEIVGEASYQDALWMICRAAEGDRIRHSIVAVLVPEPTNAYDPNAISVHVDGHVVGYFCREDAVSYGPGLHTLMSRCGGYVALRGVIVGGGYYPDGPGRLG